MISPDPTLEEDQGCFVPHRARVRGPLFFDQIPCHGHGIELQMIVERRDTAAVVGAQHIEQGQEMIGSGNGIAGIFLFVLCSYRKKP